VSAAQPHIRDITPADKAALRRLHARLSDETRYRRFHSAKTELTRGDLKYLTEIDGHDHVALVAEDPARPGELLGVVRAVRNGAGSREAEIAIVVRDDLQMHGLGAVLVDALRERVDREGVGALVAEVQGDNYRALRFFQGQGARQRQAGSGGGVWSLELPVRLP
jgi:acetyltransferase